MNNYQIAGICFSVSGIFLSIGLLHGYIRKMKNESQQAVKLIKPVSIRRDETGCWWHPDMPEFDEGDEDKFKAWKEQQGIETTWAEMQDEIDWDHPYFEEGLCDFNFWVAKTPEGEGWFTLYIADSEDGPVWVWARRKESDKS